MSMMHFVIVLLNEYESINEYVSFHLACKQIAITVLYL